jgi:hypothetical protein
VDRAAAEVSAAQAEQVELAALAVLAATVAQVVAQVQVARVSLVLGLRSSTSERLPVAQVVLQELRVPTARQGLMVLTVWHLHSKAMVATAARAEPVA